MLFLFLYRNTSLHIRPLICLRSSWYRCTDLVFCCFNKVFKFSMVVTFICAPIDSTHSSQNVSAAVSEDTWAPLETYRWISQWQPKDLRSSLQLSPTQLDPCCVLSSTMHFIVYPASTAQVTVSIIGCSFKSRQNLSITIESIFIAYYCWKRSMKHRFYSKHSLSKRSLLTIPMLRHALLFTKRQTHI